MRKSVLRHVWDGLGSPLRLLLLSDDGSTRLGFTSLEEERIRAVLPQLRGRLLDVAAGRNALVRRWIERAGRAGQGAGRVRESLGVDVRDGGGGALVVESASRLPFEDACFDTVTLIACLNQIPDRIGALKEALRVLVPGGRVVVTVIDPVLGEIGRRLGGRRKDGRREEQPGDVAGIWARDVVALCEGAGFEMRSYARFVYGLNQLFVGERPAESAATPRPATPP